MHGQTGTNSNKYRTKGGLIMAGPLDVKVTVTGPLKNILGKSTITRKDILKQLWHGKNGIHKLGLQGEKGDTVKSKGKTYKGGQVVHCGDNPDWKKMCGGKNKVSMTEVLKYAYKYVKD
jgi:chromatin remodeling complex protein RSC6